MPTAVKPRKQEASKHGNALKQTSQSFRRQKLIARVSNLTVSYIFLCFLAKFSNELSAGVSIYPTMLIGAADSLVTLHHPKRPIATTTMAWLSKLSKYNQDFRGSGSQYLGIKIGCQHKTESPTDLANACTKISSTFMHCHRACALAALKGNKRL